jgi:NAD(P)-dependent dehydrogenase (short-subunit alcohol dehydrogenase family)
VGVTLRAEVLVPTVVITGANRGIGLAFARAFKERGYTVVGTTREPQVAVELASLGVRVEEVDVTDDASVAQLGERLAGMPVDRLINNAGVLRRDRLDQLDSAAILRQFDVNALGPLRVSQALVANLRASSNAGIVAITSRMGSIADNTSGAFYGYRMSKAALNAAMKSLCIDLSPIPVMVVHPGYVRTRLTGELGDLTPDDAVARMMPLIENMTPANSGRFYHRDGHELPW